MTALDLASATVPRDKMGELLFHNGLELKQLDFSRTLLYEADAADERNRSEVVTGEFEDSERKRLESSNTPMKMLYAHTDDDKQSAYSLH